MTVSRFATRLASLALALSAAIPAASAATVKLDVNRRDAAGTPYIEHLEIDPLRTVIVESDIWNHHWDVAMDSRGAAVVPRVNDGYEAARALGIAVLHAQADIVNPPASDPMRRKVNTIPDVPLPPWPGTNFFNPLPPMPYNNPYFPSMAPPGVSPIGQQGPVQAWTAAHPDMVIDRLQDVWLNATRISQVYGGSSSWNSSARDLQELHNYTSAHDIETVIYFGGATNISALGKGFGMIQAKRLGLNVIIASDMAFTYTGNGYDYRTNQVKPSLTPDSGEREVNAWIEQKFDGTFNFAQLLETQPQFAYTSRVSQEPGIISYWRLDGKNGYKDVQDVMRVQEAWNIKANGTGGVELGAPGAIAGDSDTAARFDGTNALLVSPIFRNDTPVGSPLRSLSANSFSVEAWVQVDAGLGSQQWIVSHDAGSRGTVDFLLGIDPNGAFRFTTRGLASVVTSNTLVTQQDLINNRWRHVVGVQDAVAGELRLYVDGQLEQSSPLLGSGIDVGSSLQIGSRGGTTVAANGTVTNAGFEFFRGALDEVAIYGVKLDAQTIQEHYQLGIGQSLAIDGLSLEIDRQSGVASLVNHSPTALSISSYEIESGVGSLRPLDWQSVAAATGENGAPTTATSFSLIEQAASGGSLTIGSGAEIALGAIFTPGPWQDIQLHYALAGGEEIAAKILYEGVQPVIGDFDGSGAIDPADWASLVHNYRSNVASLPIPERHRRGDIDGDKSITMTDIVLFRSLYAQVNGAAAMQSLSVPEPASGLIGVMIVGAFGNFVRRQGRVRNFAENTKDILSIH